MPAVVPASSSLRAHTRTGVAAGLAVARRGGGAAVAVGPRRGSSGADRRPARPTPRSRIHATSRKAHQARARAQAGPRTCSGQRPRPRVAAAATGPRTSRPAQPPGPLRHPAVSYFSFPNRSKAESLAIRNRVLLTIRSAWGARRDSLGIPQPHNGTIRMTSWSFDDWPSPGRWWRHEPWSQRPGDGSCRRQRRPRRLALAAQEARHEPLPAGPPDTREMDTFARQCRGSCRGSGGTAHAKYFLFGNVGSHHLRIVTTDLDEPDQHRLPGPVEPRPGGGLRRGLLRLPGRLPAGPPGLAGHPALPRGQDRRRGRLLLPATGRQPGHRPGDADPERGLLPRGQLGGPAAATPRSASSSTPCTATAACGSPGSCATCGTAGATSGSSTRSAAGPS